MYIGPSLLQDDIGDTPPVYTCMTLQEWSWQQFTNRASTHLNKMMERRLLKELDWSKQVQEWKGKVIRVQKVPRFKVQSDEAKPWRDPAAWTQELDFDIYWRKQAEEWSKKLLMLEGTDINDMLRKHWG